MSKWSASFKEGAVSLDELQTKCKEVFGKDSFERLGRANFITLNLTGGECDKNRRYLEEILIPFGLISLIPLELTADEGETITGGRSKVQEPSPEVMAKIKEMILAKKTNKEIRDATGISETCWERYIVAMKRIWLDK